MLKRCVKISALAAISLSSTVNPVAATTGMILVDAGQSGFGALTPLWALAMIIAAAASWFWREATVRVPLALKAWVGDSWSRLVATSALIVLGAYALA